MCAFVGCLFFVGTHHTVSGLVWLSVLRWDTSYRQLLVSLGCVIRLRILCSLILSTNPACSTVCQTGWIRSLRRTFAWRGRLSTSFDPLGCCHQATGLPFARAHRRRARPPQVGKTSAGG